MTDLSAHAYRRIRGRGISKTQLDAVLNFFDIDAFAGDKCRFLGMSKRAAHEAAEALGDPQLSSRLLDIAAIENDEGNIVTVFHRHRRLKTLRGHR